MSLSELSINELESTGNDGRVKQCGPLDHGAVLVCVDGENVTLIARFSFK